MAYATSTTIGTPTELTDFLSDEMVAAGWVLERTDGLPTGIGKVWTDASADEATAITARGSNGTPGSRVDIGVGEDDSNGAVEVWDLFGSPDPGGLSRIINYGQRVSGNLQGFEGDLLGGGDYTKVSIFTGTNAANTGRYAYVVCEARPGLFWHWCFGTINKAGAFSGGFFCTASSTGDATSDSTWAFQWNMPRSGTSWIRCDDFFTGYGQQGAGATSRWFERWAFAGQDGLNINMFAPLYQGGLQSFSQRTTFCPIWAMITGSGSGPNVVPWKLLGHVPDIRFCSMDGREPNETIVIGGDTWHLFPMFRKTTDGISVTSSAYKTTRLSGDAPNHDSNLMGLAYKENP